MVALSWMQSVMSPGNDLMWLRFSCTACGGGIKIGEELAGRKVRCPLCLCATDVPAASPAVIAAPVAGVSAASPRPGTEPGGALLASDSAVATLPQPKKKRKKRRRRHDIGDEPDKMDEWLHGVIILGVTVGVLFLTALVGIMAGHGFDVLYYTILSIVLLPPTLIGMGISMVAASMMLGGVNFGDLRAAIAKAIALCLVTNVIALIPNFGVFLAAPVWIGGLMALYRLDGFETCLVWLVNWGLGWVLQIAVLAIVGPMLLAGAGEGLKLDVPDSGPAQFKLPAGMKKLPGGKGFPGGKDAPGGKEPEGNDD
jgi:hypothetical protein